MPTPAQGETNVAGAFHMNAGMNSWSQPTALPDSQYAVGMNVTCRGGKVRTRPGTAIMANIAGANAQGGKFFVPDVGTPAYMAAVDGKIWVANAPFRDFRQLPNIQFSQWSQFITMTVCMQTTDYDAAGNLFFLDQARPIVIFQDGVTRAAYWDGNASGHINPTISASNSTLPNTDGTRIGLWSVWSNNRLWISRNNQIFASDIGNPLKFTETQYISEARGFYLNGECTGMVESPDRTGIIAFTKNDAIFLKASIQDRTQWITTPNFQSTLLPNNGCVAPRSLVNQYGLTWWFGATGLQNLDSALNQNITSKLTYQDAAMAASKQNIGADMSGICAGYHENYFLLSVPSGDPYNRHTWALDQNPFEGNTNTWASYWTGWRPVEWSRAIINGQEILFFMSKDNDGAVRIWKAFLDQHTDNGCAITCMLQTKQHNMGDVFRKKFRYARTYLSEIWGEVAFRMLAVPYTGAMFAIGHKWIVATSGQVYDDEHYGGTQAGFDHEFKANRPQSRLVYSEQGDGNTLTCTACAIEKADTDNLDYAFGLLLVWSGEMAVDGYQLFVGRDPEKESGRCEQDEIAPKSMAYNGCGAKSLFTAGSPWGPVYTATATECVARDGIVHGDSTASTSGSGSVVTACSTQTKTSWISQADADRLAACGARFDAEFQSGIYL